MSPTFFLDPQRCVGCRACVAACAECASHPGVSMIHIDSFAGSWSPQTMPTICMHCVNPPCANACPTDAIKVDSNGVVLSAEVSRCIYCRNCVIACPFGVPKYQPRQQLMVKCDQCYDRTSRGLKPMCATVCPTGALAYGEPEEIMAQRGGQPVNQWLFGSQELTTRVMVFAPRDVIPLMVAEPEPYPQAAGLWPEPLARQGAVVEAEDVTAWTSASDLDTREWAEWEQLFQQPISDR